MFIARRKLLWIVMLVIVVATVNHYMYLESPTTKVLPHTQGEVSVKKHISPIIGERKYFNPGKNDFLRVEENADHDTMRPTELSVQEEVNINNLLIKRIEYVTKMDLKLAAEEQLVTAQETNVKALMDNDDDEDTTNINSDSTKYIPRRRVVHLDLKGAPLNISYFESLFPLLKEAGATTILLEYEDMFPFWGELRNLSALNAYSKEEVKLLLRLATASELEVIPLVQTFGHLEFALKLEEYKDLREVPEYPQALCPSNERSWALVTQMVDQVLSLHPDARWLHVGCDEVFHLGKCSLCQSRTNISSEKEISGAQMRQRQNASRILFLEHVHRVASYVRQKKVIPIIWDDMLRGIPENMLLQSGIGPLVEPMVWVYVEDVYYFVDNLTWTTFSSVFSHVWSASAFKGAFGERLFSVNVKRHVSNNLAWLEVMQSESKRLSFRGIVLTGWSRYDHFAVLCELLPAAIPSLVLNLAILKEGEHDVTATRNAYRLLKCTVAQALMTAEELIRNPEQWDLQKWCTFPGSEFYGLLTSFNKTRWETEMVYEKLTKRDGWMSEYNMRHRFSSPQRVSDAMRGVSYLQNRLQSLRVQLADKLLMHFDGYTVDEWLEQNLQPLEDMLEELDERSTKILSAESVWPRRPLLSGADEEGIGHHSDRAIVVV